MTERGSGDPENVTEEVEKIARAELLGRYEQRRLLIRVPDRTLIDNLQFTGHPYGDRMMHEVIARVCGEKHRAFFREKLAGKPLFNIGAGIGGVGDALRFLKDMNVGRVTLVDPYYGERAMDREEKEQLTQEGLQGRVDFSKTDGLSFLIAQRPDSGNVVASAINVTLINDREYLKRMAQEIFRVVPRDGIFITFTSNHIEDEANELFPYKKLFSGMSVFAKEHSPAE